MFNIRFKKLLLFSIIGIILLSVSSVSAVSDLSPETSDVNDDLASTVDIYDSSSALQGDSIDLSNNQGSLCNVLPIADSNGNVLATADDELIGNDSAEERDDSGDEEEPVNTSILDKNSNHTFIYGNNYALQLVDNESNPLPYQDIIFTISNGASSYEVSQISDENGYVRLPLKYKGGIWNISAVFEGNEGYNGSSFNASVSIYEKTSVVMPSYSFRGSSITIRFKTSTGEYLANVKFTFIVDGVKYTKYTDSKGVFTFALPNKQYCVMNISFGGSGYNLPCEKSIKMPVYVKTNIKNNNLYVLKGKKFAVTLKNQYGSKLKYKIVQLTICGKTYTAKTNKKGIAYFKIKVSGGLHDVKYSYLGSSYYYKSSGGVALTVIDISKQRKNGLNQKGSSIRAYLIGKGRCKVTASIRKLAKKLTKGYSSKLDKAGIIMHYVADQIYYDYYANSRKGAHKTLKSKYGNCCDQASLVIALCRAAKIPARYAHAQGCTFNSGFRSGHVWAQIKVGKMWYVADPTSYRNYLGKVNNWNTKSYYSLHKYAYIPF